MQDTKNNDVNPLILIAIFFVPWAAGALDSMLVLPAIVFALVIAAIAFKPWK